MLVTNALLMLAFAFEASRTSFWRRLPSFNFTNIGTVILAALASQQSHQTDSDNSFTDAELDGSNSAPTADLRGINVKWQYDQTGRVVMVY